MSTTVSASPQVWFAQSFAAMVDNVSGAIVGKQHVIQLAFTAMLAEGHLLLEDAPGTGKTSLAKAMAATISGSHSRIQFTPDLLPSDVIGVTIFDQQRGSFEFHPGPVFATVVLADEINRASPKTQSALLEVMEESKVTVDGVTREVGRPFMVIATQNPIEQVGTYRLPEAQLDRFLMRTSLGYPDHESAMAVLRGSANRDRTAGLRQLLDATVVTQMAEIAATTHVQDAILDYALRLAEATRSDPQTTLGASMRGALALVRCAKVWACAAGRDYVVPDDVKVLAQPVLAHRLVVETEAEFAGASAEDIVARVVAQTPPPRRRDG